MAKRDGISEDEAKAIVADRLEEVQKNYSGAGAACMSALTVMDIAADYGVKLKYGAASTPSKLAKDIDPCNISDCRNFVSWALDKGFSDDIYSMNVGQLGMGYDENGIHEKRTSDYSTLNAGDIITKNSTHAMMMVYNDPDSKTFIIAESSGHNNGVRLREVSYEKAKELGYTGVSAETVYDGTADCYNYGRNH